MFPHSNWLNASSVTHQSAADTRIWRDLSIFRSSTGWKDYQLAIAPPNSYPSFIAWYIVSALRAETRADLIYTMFHFFSQNKLDAVKVDNASQRQTTMRGSRAGVVAASSVGPMLNGVLSETVSGQLGDKDSSGMQDHVESKWTDESVAITESSEDGIERQRRVRRGKQAAIEAGASPVYDWTQGRFPGMKPEVVENGTGASGHFSQTTSITATDETRESTALKKALHRRACKQAHQIKHRRCFPNKNSVGPPVDRCDRFPLRARTYPTLIPSSSPEEPPRRLCKLSTDSGQVVLQIPPQRPLPLQMTLYDGSHELPIMHAEPIVPPAYSLLILVVAVAYGGLKDPQCDADILNLIFKDHHSEYTYFDSISGENATFDAIEDAIGKLYREATKSSESKVLILLTGEGDEHNCMCLMDGKYITDRDLRRWMWKLQIDCYPKNRTVTIILDYCRTDKQTLVGSHTGVEFICSCSPGQRSAGLEFPNRKDIPRSCFLLALMMASHEPGRNGSDLVGSIDYELGRLSRLLEFTHKRIHEIGRCEPCLKGEPCPMPLPRPQHPDWQRSGSMKAVYSLVDSLSSMGIAAKVYDFFTRNVNFCRANGLPIGANILAPQPSLQTGTTQHNRGSSKPVQAAALDEYVRSVSHSTMLSAFNHTMAQASGQFTPTTSYLSPSYKKPPRPRPAFTQPPSSHSPSLLPHFA
ncbi:hypothetical protein AG1IA_09749 [Rhizoctonia solani AG-1 IA]|uniref:Peptidase C14 caspase domain-containing protein n=1 Tax=Thanatephorus cucumeris (strain AG1-IA) TaxID=983506 RepID=L8WDG2_THACA|nr:hypothetical protein AG1IA_09749 [Rhizoctonia solani AG-1 IA]